MLDTDTRRRIDTARDILVGKVPDPKSQVEQITIALIYKFMDDMDAQSEELGGKRKFFAGEFARYGWAKLMRSGLGGHEMLGLYAESIQRMPENPGIPPLFRDIFKNAYLPYRDPETLRAFLKIIDEFSYDHSERLGDAFEYLLSVLGSQGEAGQFRTPRHIIDFIVEIVDPKLGERVLDPACGTAGFLISAYKHILKANTDAKGNVTLTPDQRQELARSFTGYDISPDMVRLSLVNMYLHGFSDPHIHEYDTLTSLERWNEYADVVLANPPFMSPKGGIKPHNRFSVESKRSEVLFVDYMAEHLTPNGRAGIIVPEGIIFQSQSAYVQLRKMLVEDYLVAVISLPSGVFQPYSGVKTSILILDKALARKADSIAFFKVESDGFDLGAQRKSVERNDLPRVALALRTLLGAQVERARASGAELTAGQTVTRSRILGSRDRTLAAEQYHDARPGEHGFAMVSLGQVAQVTSGQSPPGESYNEAGEGVPFYQGKTEFGDRFIGEPVKWTTAPQRFAQVGDILMSVRAPVGPVNICTTRICIGRGLAAITPDPERLLSLFAFYVLRSMESSIKGTPGATFACISRDGIQQIQIPLPPLDVQQEIVAEIEGYQKVIDGARAVVENYRPHIPIDPDWPVTTIGDCCEVRGGKRLPKGEQFSTEPTSHPYIRVSDFRDQTVDVSDLKYVSDQVHRQIARYTISSRDVYISIAGTIGLMGIIPKSLDGANLTENAAKLVLKGSEIDARFLSMVGNGEFVQSQIRALTHASGVPKLALERIATLRIPVPPLANQRDIVAEIESERALLNANRELITRFEKKIQATLARVWGEIREPRPEA